MGLALGTNLKFYASVTKGLKLKVRKFWGLIPSFVEVTGEKLVKGTFLPPLPPSHVNRANGIQKAENVGEDLNIPTKIITENSDIIPRFYALV